MRRRRPLMRTAMIGGAGYMAGKKVAQGREEDAARDQQMQDMQMQQAQQAQMQQAPPMQAAPPPPPPPPAGGMSPNVIEQLKQLGELHEQGILTDEEFTAQKKTLLSG